MTTRYWKKFPDCAGKDYRDFRRTRDTELNYQAVSRSLVAPLEQLEIRLPGGQGTWLHPRLLFLVGQWVSPDFAAACLEILERFVTGRLTTEESERAAAATAAAVATAVTQLPSEAEREAELAFQRERARLAEQALATQNEQAAACERQNAAEERRLMIRREMAAADAALREEEEAMNFQKYRHVVCLGRLSPEAAVENSPCSSAALPGLSSSPLPRLARSCWSTPIAKPPRSWVSRTRQSTSSWQATCPA